MKGVKALLADGSFTLPSSPATRARKVGECVFKRIQENLSEAAEFEHKLQTLLNTCLQSQSSSQRVKRERMWSLYHILRTSDSYHTEWQVFQIRCGISEESAIFFQYIGDYVFKEMIKLHFPLESAQGTATGPGALTNEETNALRYAAGYVPRALKKALSKSAHPLKKDLQLCLLDLLDDGDEECSDESKDWIKLINRGGLTLISDITFQLFQAMEHELRKHLRKHKTPTLNDGVKQALVVNEDVQFLWSMISADWEEASASALLQMIVNQWVEIRGFSYAGAWVEQYEATQKKTTQKSKGVRKQLLPRPKQAPVDTTQET